MSDKQTEEVFKKVAQTVTRVQTRSGEARTVVKTNSDAGYVVVRVETARRPATTR